MKTFRFKSDCTFEAVDIEDALGADHFRSFIPDDDSMTEMESPYLDFVGSMELKPEE